MSDEEGGQTVPLNIFKAIGYTSMDFMTHTSIHGAKYVCEDERTIWERILWVIMLCVGLGAGGFMVYDIYGRYASTPTISIIEHTHYPTWRLPFPAITICNNNRILQTRAEALVGRLTIPDHLNRTSILSDLRILGEFTAMEILPDNNIITSLQDLLNFNEVEIEDVMQELSQPCHEMLERCSWQNEIVKCTDFFEPRKSHHGYCCSFNYIGIRDSKKNNKKGLNDSPIHSRLYGQMMGLTVLINPAIDDYFVASYISEGVTVHVHNPDTYPDDSVIMKMVPIRKEVLVPIRLSSRICSDEVRALSPTVRDCLFFDENHLHLFPEYIADNCLTECKMEYSLQLCSCVPYYYPNNDSHRVCDLLDLECLHKHFHTFHTFKPGIESEMKAVVDDHKEELSVELLQAKDAMGCNCPSQCETVSYQARVSWGDFTASKHSVNQLFGPDTNDTNRILLHMFVESNFSQVTKRDIATSRSVLLALLGGVCCLFLGCSFVSIIELLYFLFVRIPEFLQKNKNLHEEEICNFSPQRVRRGRPSAVRRNNIRTIEILPWSAK